MIENNSFPLWNQLKLDMPPLVTFDYTLNEYEHLFSNTDYHLLFESNLNKLTSLFQSNQLDDEIILFEKLIFKNWNPLRKEASMQQMRQLKRLLSKWKELRLNELVVSLREMTNSKQGTTRKLPSKEVYEFFLVRLQSAFKLSSCMLSLIKNKLYIHLMKLIHNAIYLANNILFVSAVSRMYFILKKYKQLVVYAYNTLRPYIDYFKSTSIKWSTSFTLAELPLELEIHKGAKSCEKEADTNATEAVVEENLLAFTSLSQQDIGIKIERNERSVAVSNDEFSSFLKWKNSLVKSINKSVQSDVVKFKKELRKFLIKKHKISNEKYVKFLNDLLAKKSIGLKELSGVNKEKKLLLKTFYKTIKKFIQNKSIK